MTCGQRRRASCHLIERKAKERPRRAWRREKPRLLLLVLLLVLVLVLVLVLLLVLLGGGPLVVLLLLPMVLLLPACPSGAAASAPLLPLPPTPCRRRPTTSPMPRAVWVGFFGFGVEGEDGDQCTEDSAERTCVGGPSSCGVHACRRARERQLHLEAWRDEHWRRRPGRHLAAEQHARAQLLRLRLPLDVEAADLHGRLRGPRRARAVALAPALRVRHRQ